MTRRLELPDELIFQDGTKVSTPQELATCMEANPKKTEEIWQRLQQGDLERWFFQGGWEALAQHIAHLRCSGKEIS